MGTRCLPQSTMTEVMCDLSHVTKKIRSEDFMSREALMGFLILGLPGWGKTRIVEQKFKYSSVLPIASYIEDDLSSRMGVEGELITLVLPSIKTLVETAIKNPKVPCLMLLDEIPQGSVAVERIICGWVNERCVADIQIPDNIVIVATGNLRKHQAGAGSALSHMISRFRCYEITPDVEGWLEWGINKLHESVSAYIHMKPVAAYCWQDNATEEAMAQQYRDAARDWVPYPNARSWTALSEAMYANPDLGYKAMAGFVGPERAGEFNAMRGISIPSHEDLLENKVDLPEKPMAKWVALIRAGQKLTPGNAKLTAAFLLKFNPELTEVGLRICGKVAKAFLKKHGVRLKSDFHALIYSPEGGTEYFPGFREVLLAPGSRYSSMLEVEA